ncbi:MAG TPA: hypothetical protein VFE42_33580 [Chloroflexota bacterium]|nr:hypothetical protein [Chloroflexota bacterium]
MPVRRRLFLLLAVTFALLNAGLLRPAGSVLFPPGPAPVQAQAPSLIYTGDTPTPAPAPTGRGNCAAHGPGPRLISRGAAGAGKAGSGPTTAANGKTVSRSKVRPKGRARSGEKIGSNGKPEPRRKPAHKPAPRRRRPVRCVTATSRRPTVQPTATITATITPPATSTPVLTATDAPPDVPADASTPTDVPTDVPADTDTPTPTDIPTDTPTATPTDVPTDTATPTDVPTDTPTATAATYPSDVPVQLSALPQAFFPAGGEETSIQSTVADPSMVIQSEDATIVDGTGSVIKDLGPAHTYQNPSASQIRYWFWDGTDAGGSLVSPGDYTVVVLVRTADGKTGIGTLPITVQSG